MPARLSPAAARHFLVRREKNRVWPEICIDTPGLRNQNTRLVFSWEGYPSGQREQTVNLPAYAFVGSNPTPSTMVLAPGEAGEKAGDCGQQVGYCHCWKHWRV